MICWVLLFIFCFPLYGRIAAEAPIHDPDVNRNVTEIIASKGYPVEEHTVQTADGYLLSLQRIPHGRTGISEGEDKFVVLLIHGVTGDANNWVLNFPNQSLGFVLADAGYDVWLLNTRGCTYSKKHVEYTTKQYQFWNFSFEEVGQYDVPATIDYILDDTGKEDLFVIGHSQGTTATFVMLCDRPDYNDKVKLYIALAPVAKLKHTSLIPRLLSQVAEPASVIINILTSGEFLPNSQFMRTIQKIVCAMGVKEACEELIFAVGGKDRQQLNETRLPVYLAHFPASTSIKSLVHYAQLVKSDKFRKYDYGSWHNLKYYHQEEPPDYDVSRITAPVALMWSTNDILADPKDVEYLRANIKPLVFDYQVPYPYNHYDFLLGLNTADIINKPIIQLLSQSKI